MPSPRPSRLALPLLVALATCAGTARAEDFEEFGFGARAQGMGGAFTALASDATAAYYNPGGLILSRHVNLTLGFSFADYWLEFDSQSGADDDDVERIQDLSAFTLGVSTTIPLDIPDRLALGIALFVPTRGIIQLEAHTASAEPEWFSYGARHDRLHALVALGLKLTDWLSVGAGASIFVDAAGGTRISTGVSDPVDPSFSLRLKPDAGAVLGILVTPADWLSLGVTYRSEVSFKLDFPAVASVQPVATIDLNLETISFFSPHQVQLGAALSLGESWLLTLDLSWVNWSAYRDPFIVESSTTAAVTRRERVRLRDVISPKLGAEVVVNEWAVLRAGYAYRTSRVPDQGNEPTNLVDSDKHVLTFGVGLTFGATPDLPSEEAEFAEGRSQTMEQALDDASADLDLFVQWHIHSPVSARKPLPDPVGDWEAEGYILNLGFTLTLRF